jgi:hypothetical protein
MAKKKTVRKSETCHQSRSLLYFRRLRKPPIRFCEKWQNIAKNPKKMPKKGFSQAKNGTGLSLFANLRF